MSDLISDVINMLDFDEEQINADGQTKSKIKIIIENGKQHLRAFNPLLDDDDFKEPSRAQSLLFDYVRYAYSNATEMFDANFATEILMLRHEYEVTAYEAEE